MTEKPSPEKLASAPEIPKGAKIAPNIHAVIRDVGRGDLLGDLLQAHEQNLEERSKQAAHEERVHKQHAALGLCDAEVVIEPDRAADPANRDADSGEQHVEPHDEPHTVPDALAHLLVVLRPGATAFMPTAIAKPENGSSAPNVAHSSTY